MRKPFIYAKHAAATPKPIISAPIKDFFNSHLSQGRCTHDARLNRDIEGGIWQGIFGYFWGQRSIGHDAINGLQFCMSRGLWGVLQSRKSTSDLRSYVAELIWTSDAAKASSAYWRRNSKSILKWCLDTYHGQCLPHPSIMNRVHGSVSHICCLVFVKIITIPAQGRH